MKEHRTTKKHKQTKEDIDNGGKQTAKEKRERDSISNKEGGRLHQQKVAEQTTNSAYQFQNNDNIDNSNTSNKNNDNDNDNNKEQHSQTHKTNKTCRMMIGEEIKQQRRVSNTYRPFILK